MKRRRVLKALGKIDGRESEPCPDCGNRIPARRMERHRRKFCAPRPDVRELRT